MSQTLSLYRLQQVDIQIDRANSRLNAIQNILDDDENIRLVKEQADSEQTKFELAEQELKNAEIEAQNQKIKIEQTEASLYGGKGHSPKELLDLQNDTAALKRHLATLEDVQLEAMLKVENCLAANQAAKSEFETAKKRSAEEKRGLQDEQAILQKELEKLFSERAAAADPVPQDAIKVYDQLRLQRRGLAVAVIRDNSCSACGAGLTAAQMQSSRASSQMAYCPSCGRILYGS